MKGQTKTTSLAVSQLEKMKNDKQRWKDEMNYVFSFAEY